MPTNAIIITVAVTAVIGTLALIMAWADHQSTIYLREKREKEDNR